MHTTRALGKLLTGIEWQSAYDVSIASVGRMCLLLITQASFHCYEWAAQEKPWTFLSLTVESSELFPVIGAPTDISWPPDLCDRPCVSRAEVRLLYALYGAPNQMVSVVFLADPPCYAPAAIFLPEILKEKAALARIPPCFVPI